MTSDLQALLAAIVADPSDDVARLVYADCLQEHGNSARAEFIRLQIETERHHPDSHTWAELERQAQALFDQHWIEWWGEVCAAVGYPMPAPKPGGRLGRFASRVGLRPPAGIPYQHSGFCCWWSPGGPFTEFPESLMDVHFRGGFPDQVDLTSGRSDFLTVWPTVSPLRQLRFTGAHTDWRDGPHLVGVRTIAIDSYDPLVISTVLQSPHLSNLESLSLEIPDYSDRDDGNDWIRPFAEVLARVLSAPRISQLRRLAVPVWDDRMVEVIASASNLRGLESLEVSCLADVGADRRLAMLARSPHLAGLKELTLYEELTMTGLAAAVQNPAWSRIRKLDLHLGHICDRLDPLAEANGLSELEELRLSGFRYSPGALACLRRSPLLKQLRHFAVRAGGYLWADYEIADAIDSDRIETFAIGSNDATPRVVAMLKERFGNKFRLLP